MPAISLANWLAQTNQPKKSALVQKITNESVFLRILNFVPVDGQSYHYGEQTTTGGVEFRALGETYDPDAGIVNPRVEFLAILGGSVKTDHQLVNKQGDAARSNSIMAKVKRVGLTFDKTVIKGNAEGDSPKEFRGLQVRCVNKQLIIAGVNGAALTLAMLDSLLNAVVGTHPQKVLVMNKWCADKVRNLLNAAGGASPADYANNVESYRGARIEVLDEDGDDTPILDFDEACGSSNVTTSIYCIRPGTDVEGEYVQGLIGSDMIEHYESGMQGTQHVDVVEMNGGLAVFHGRAAARLQGITKA